MMYIHFYHGRNTPDEDLDDWGFDGPVVGPLRVSWTYDWIKFFHKNDLHHLVTIEELVPINGKYYGDFEVLIDTELKPHQLQTTLTLKEFIKLNKVPEEWLQKQG
jgi:hypothetical protein